MRQGRHLRSRCEARRWWWRRSASRSHAWPSEEFRTVGCKVVFGEDGGDSDHGKGIHIGEEVWAG